MGSPRETITRERQAEDRRTGDVEYTELLHLQEQSQ